MKQSPALTPVEFKISLQNEFARRCRVNGRYSVRAFARHLALDPSTVSQILAGRRKVSAKMIQHICQKAGLAPEPQGDVQPEVRLLSQDIFVAIADWYHYALLDLTMIKGFKSDPSWIAKKLGISAQEAHGAIDRLIRLGLLLKAGGHLKKAEPRYENYVEGQTSLAHKEYQRQVIRKALNAIDVCAQERKDITGITVAANSKKLGEAKAKIKKFRAELAEFMEDGEGDSVYHLSVQLFPLTDVEG